MGAFSGPETVDDGIVLALDAAPNPRFSNYKGRSVAFDGNGDKLSCTPSNLTGEFTIEGWWYANAFPATTVLFGNWGGGCLLRLANANSELQWYTTGLLSGMRGSIGFTLSTGTWYHVAVSRDSSNVHRTFVNGTQIASETNSDSISMSNLCIGSENTSSGTTDIWNGYISNFRIVDGTALYTSNFTPPTEPLTAVTNTVLLTCQGTTITDASSSGHTITPIGNAAINYNGPFSGSGWTDLTNNGNSGTLTNGPVFTQEPKQEPFGGAGAVEFDGTGDYLSIPDSTDLDFGSGDFTIECWVYPDSGSTNGAFITKRSSTAYFAPFVLRQINTTSLAVLMSTSGSSWNFNQTATSALTTDAWQHVAVTRSGTAIKAFVNGTEVISSTLSGALMTNTQIAVIGTDFAYDLDGKISNLRVIKGTALYTSNFTPKRQPLLPESAPNTVLLTCQKGTIRDRSSSAHAITINGDAKSISGASYFEFDGTDDYIDLTQTIQFDTSDFSISGWFRSNSGNTSYKQIWNSGYNGGTPDVEIAVSQTNNRLTFYVRPPSPGLTATTTYSVDDNVWRHFTATKTSSEISLYVNGSLVDSTSGSLTSDVDTAGVIPRIGNGLYNINNRPFKGNISQIAVYNKALTAAEVKQNYRNTKGRYGL